jgi:hypothetical protein
MLHLSLGDVAAVRTTRRVLTRFRRFIVRTFNPSSL